MAKGRSVRSRSMAHCCLSSGTERTAVPRLARQPADADATASSTSSQGPKGAITNGTSMPSRSHRGVCSLVDTASSFQPAVKTSDCHQPRGSCPRWHKGGQRNGVLEVGRIDCGTWSISGVWPGERRPICSFCDRALSDGERPGANASLPDLLIALSTLRGGPASAGRSANVRGLPARSNRTPSHQRPRSVDFGLSKATTT